MDSTSVGKNTLKYKVRADVRVTIWSSYSSCRWNRPGADQWQEGKRRLKHDSAQPAHGIFPETSACDVILHVGQERSCQGSLAYCTHTWLEQCISSSLAISPLGPQPWWQTKTRSNIQAAGWGGLEDEFCLLMGYLITTAHTHLLLRAPGKSYRAGRPQIRWQSLGYSN